MLAGRAPSRNGSAQYICAAHKKIAPRNLSRGDLHQLFCFNYWIGTVHTICVCCELIQQFGGNAPVGIG
jgi:hypothetical protein